MYANVQLYSLKLTVALNQGLLVFVILCVNYQLKLGVGRDSYNSDVSLLLTIKIHLTVGGAISEKLRSSENHPTRGRGH